MSRHRPRRIRTRTFVHRRSTFNVTPVWIIRYGWYWCIRLGLVVLRINIKEGVVNIDDSVKTCQETRELVFKSGNTQC
jgi:hypothetical protein